MKSNNQQTGGNRLFDDFSKVTESGFSVLNGLKKQLEDFTEQCVTRLLKRMDLVTREEFEVLKARVEKLESAKKPATKTKSKTRKAKK